MHGGIDIGTETVVVATPGGTARYRNAVRPVDDADETGGSTPTVQTERGVYAVGDSAVPESAEGTVPPGEDVTRLFGEAGDHGPAGAALETLFEATDDRPPDERPLGEDLHGYVDRGSTGELSRLSADRPFDLVPVDPGMAVCYDALDTPPEGVGVALGGGQALATLALGGVPVATATVPYRDRWYDVTDAVPDVAGDSVRASWSREQYRALLADVAAALVEDGPVVSGPVAVALGGEAAPTGLSAGDLRGVEDALGVPVGSVRVTGSPAEAPARGAMVAADPDGQSGAVPAFAATDAYAPGFVDVAAATDTLGAALADDTARDRGETAIPPQEERLGLALGAVVDSVAGGTGGLRGELAETRAAVEEVESALSELEAATPSRGTVDTLAATVEESGERLDTLAADISELRAVVAGLEGESVEGTELEGAFESVSADAVQEDIDAVETALTGRIEALWEEIDGINSRLVDITARLDGVSELESELESTGAEMEALSGRVEELGRSLDGVRERVADAEDQMATGEEMASLRAELERVDGRVDAVRKRFREADWVEPAQLDSQARDLNTLRETVTGHARRLEAVEQSTSDLEDQIEQTFRNTAKAEALSSLQTEVSRLQQERTAGPDAETIEAFESRLDEFAGRLDRFQTTVDSIADSAVRQSTLDETRESLESRVTELEREATADDGTGGREDEFLRPLLAVALASAAGLGALLALEFERPAVALGFLVFVAGPAALVWLLGRGSR